jgi:hypothetical protein
MLIYHSLCAKCNNDWEVAYGCYEQLGEAFKTKGEKNCGTLMLKTAALRAE